MAEEYIGAEGAAEALIRAFDQLQLNKSRSPQEPPRVIIIPEAMLAGTTRVNDEAFETGDLVEFLYSDDEPKTLSSLSYPITRNRASNILHLIGQGYSTIAVPDDASDSAFGEDLDRDQYVKAFDTYAERVAQAIDPRLRPYVNFGIARHLNISGEAVQPSAMGRDVDLIGAILDAEATGMERGEQAVPVIVNILRDQFKASKEEGLRYALPWAYSIDYVLTPEEVAHALSGGKLVIEQIQSEPGRQPIAPYLSNEDFRARLRLVDPDLLSAQAEVLPIAGELTERYEKEGGHYLVFKSSIMCGSPLAPPSTYCLVSRPDEVAPPCHIEFMDDS